MRFLRRLWRRLTSRPLDALLRDCLRYGAVLLEFQGGSEEYGSETWRCVIRVQPSSRDLRGLMNSWIGSGGSPTDAVLDALAEVEANPSFINPKGNYAPKLGGREFDPE